LGHQVAIHGEYYVSIGNLVWRILVKGTRVVATTLVQRVGFWSIRPSGVSLRPTPVLNFD
jgi:hypothetical protein